MTSPVICCLTDSTRPIRPALVLETEPVLGKPGEVMALSAPDELWCGTVQQKTLLFQSLFHIPVERGETTHSGLLTDVPVAPLGAPLEPEARGAAGSTMTPFNHSTLLQFTDPQFD